MLSLQVRMSFLLGLLFTTAMGCGSGLSSTYSVTGKVVWKGGKPVDDGRIEFQSIADSTLRAVGEIERDGSFFLVTHRDGKNRKGAVPGPSRVIVEPGVDDGQRAIVIVLPKPYVIEAKENRFTIEIDRKKR